MILLSIPNKIYNSVDACTSVKDMWKRQDITIWLALQMKFERNTVPQIACRTPAVRPRDQDDPHDDAHPEGENSNQEQDDDFDFWTDSYASDDDEIPMKQVSQDIMEEVSLTIDEAKLRKMADEMLRQRCTSGDEHQKEILVSPHPQKTTPLVHSCQKDPEAPALSLINQDLLYLKKGNSRPEKIVLSLHKFPAIIFNDDDIKERTSRWVNKRIKNPYACMVCENLKNPHAKIVLIMADTGLLWSLSVFIRSSVIWERVHDFQLGIESY
ncbi:hypothetical protein Tco_0302831 [Tanacetum coccineum]